MPRQTSSLHQPAAKHAVFCTNIHPFVTICTIPHHFVPVYTNLNESAPTCNDLQQAAPISIKLDQSAPNYTKLPKTCSKPDQTAPSWANLHHSEPTWTKLVQSAKTYTNMQTSAPTCNNIHQSAWAWINLTNLQQSASAKILYQIKCKSSIETLLQNSGFLTWRKKCSGRSNWDHKRVIDRAIRVHIDKKRNFKSLDFWTSGF